MTGSSANTSANVAQLRTRDGLMVALTVVTGATDAIAFTRLGNVFTSVMTGNLVLLGMGLGRGELTTLEHTALAVASFIVGTIIGARIAGAPRSDDRVWPRPFSTALMVELALFACVAVGWWASGSHPSGPGEQAMLAGSALALGIQSSAVVRLGVSGLSTTYLTGTLTTFVHAVTTTRRLKGSGRSLCLLIALIAGAALGALLAIHAAPTAPLVSLIILSAVIGFAEVKLHGR
jgi:uncharacterized membrane protein YoaK (UPF0700 family)